MKRSRGLFRVVALQKGGAFILYFSRFARTANATKTPKIKI